jgi:hypothetical protein
VRGQTRRLTSGVNREAAGTFSKPIPMLTPNLYLRPPVYWETPATLFRVRTPGDPLVWMEFEHRRDCGQWIGAIRTGHDLLTANLGAGLKDYRIN